MTKSIETLVEDIYSLFNSEHQFDEGNVEEFGKRLATHVRNRISSTRQKPTLRLSNVGSPCDRKLWYDINEPDGAEDLPPQAYVKFLFGDILEELLLFLAKEAGHNVDGTQDTLVLSGVEGHRDAVIDGVVVDVKSASTYGMKKFENHELGTDDPFGYMAQIMSYAQASKDDPIVTDKDRVAFLAIDKTLGNIVLDIYPTSEVDYGKVIDEKRSMLAGPKPSRSFTDVPDGKSGNKKLDVQCSYCAHKFKCWPNLQVYTYSTGPRFLTKVAKEPRVDKIEAQGF